MGGISRSASVVIAFVMRTRQLSFEEAFQLVKNARPFICPNRGFVEQLRQFDPSTL